MININFGDIFKSVGPFLAKNWQTICLLIMVALYFSTKSDYSTLKKNMDIMSESYQEQIAALEALHLEEIRKREDALREYEQEINNLTEEYEKALEDLRKGSEEDVREFIRDFELQPEKLAEEIKNQYGFEYVE